MEALYYISLGLFILFLQVAIPVLAIVIPIAVVVWVFKLVTGG